MDLAPHVDTLRRESAALSAAAGEPPRSPVPGEGDEGGTIRFSAGERRDTVVQVQRAA